MRRRKRYLLAVMVIAAGSLGVVGSGVAGTGHGNGHTTTVRTHGGDSFEPNRFVKSTLRFSPGHISVPRGRTVRWQDADSSQDPHTVTLVNKDEVPSTVEEVFECPTCSLADGHFQDDTIVPVLNEGGPGLDARGDSLFFANGESISAQVTAARGTTLSYHCAIHPWMQGAIDVQ